MKKAIGFTKRMIGVMLVLALVLILVPTSASAAKKVKLNKTKVTLKVGKTVTLKLKNNKKKVKWTSSNKKVATVTSKGKVKAKKAGKATITAKVGKKKYKCKVTVQAKKRPGTILVEQLSMNSWEVALKVGEKKTLGITTVPSNATNKSVKWRSENPSVATVDQKGTVRGISEGESLIYAEKDDDYGSGQDCCIVTVTQSSTPTEKPSETPTGKPSGKLNVTSQSIDLTQTCQLFLSGETAQSWISSDTSIATVADGLVTPLELGSVKITCIDTKGFEYSCNINIKAPDIKFVPNKIYSTTLNKTNYYFIDFIITNNCDYDIIFGGKEPFTGADITCTMYYQYGFENSSTSSTAAFSLSESSSILGFAGDMNQTFVCEKDKSSTIYGFEGRTKYIPGVSSDFMWTITINNIKYSVLTDCFGKITAMTPWGASDVQ